MTAGIPTPEEVANRIRQAGRYPNSRRALERLVEVDPEVWIPALIKASNQDLGATGPTVEALLSRFSAVRPDFKSRLWLYDTIPVRVVHFLRVKADLAMWLLEQLDPNHPANRPLLARLNLELSHHLVETLRLDEAFPYSVAAVQLLEELAESDPNFTADLALAWILFAQQMFLNSPEDAIEANRAAVSVAQGLTGEKRTELLGLASVELGATLCSNGRHKAALIPLRKAYRLFKQRTGTELGHLRSTALAARELGGALLSLGRAREAQPFFEEALRNIGVLVAKDPGPHLTSYLHAAKGAARAALALKHPERNRALRNECIELLFGLAKENPRDFLDKLLGQLSDSIWSLIDEEQFDEAEQHVRQAIRMGRRWGRMTKSNPAIYLGCSYAQMASICMEGYRMEEGRRAALRARLHLRQLPPENRIRSALLDKVEKQMEFFRWYKKWYRDLTGQAGRNRSSS